jgi:nucleoside-diphosphate-sugar epimerase
MIKTGGCDYEGATGYIGSHVLTELHEHGQEVTTLARDDAHAQAVAARRATVARAELSWCPSHPSLVDEFRHGSYRK